MRELNEYILERRSTLSQFAHHPVAISGQPKDFFADVDARLYAHGKSLPFILPVGNHVSHTRNLFQFLCAVIVPDFCFKHYAASLPDFSEQIIRRIARLDSSLVNDDHSA